MERFDVAIVGGGPAGSSAAHAAAGAGASAIVLEKGVPRADRDRLGPDSTDAAGILDYWVDIMGIHPDEMPDGVVLRELDRAEFVSPSESLTLRSTGIESSYDHFGYTFHRARFDDWLRDRAEKAGATYRVGSSVRSVEVDRDDDPRHVVHVADGTEIGAEYLILADGPQRTVTNRVLDELLPDGAKASERLAAPRANHIAYQEYREFPEEVFERLDSAITFWWGYMPGHTAYPWVFPNDGTVARVGLTMPIGMDIGDVRGREQYPLLRPEDDRIPQGGEYIRRLLEAEYGDEYDIETDFPLVEDRGKSGGTETYPISSTRPIESPVGAGVAVAGGAMGTTSAFHEGGDHVAVRTGRLAGELAAGDELERYNAAWQDAIGEELTRNVALADMADGYGPADWDRTFRTARRLLKRSSGFQLFNVRDALSVGWDAISLVGRYKWHKFGLRDAGYVQLREDEYVY
jgi:electron-transferring-flavoprotein dehydrogenase